MENLSMKQTDSTPYTVSNTAKDQIAQEIFLSCEIITTILLLLIIYIFTCMVMHGLKAKKWRRPHRSDVNGRLVYTAAVVAVALTIPRFIINQIIFNVTSVEGLTESCELIMDIGNAFYFVGIYSIYFFLWLRQKTIYAHPAMKKLTGKFVAALSWTTIVVLSAAAIGVALLFIAPLHYSSDSEGCILKQSVVNSSLSGDFSFYGSYYALVTLLVVAQISLLSLFIYPMLRSGTIRKEHQISRQTSEFSLSSFPTNDAQFASNENKIAKMAAGLRQFSRSLSSSSNQKVSTLQKTIRRSIVCSVICMISDIIAMGIVSFVLPKTGPRAAPNTVYDIGTFISVFSVLVTFESYPKILTIFCGRKRITTEGISSMSEDGSNKISDRFHSVTRQQSSG